MIGQVWREVAQRVAHALSELPEVEAIAVGGSVATGMAGDSSDIDLYIYTKSPVSAERRATLGNTIGRDAENVDFWGDGTEWIDPASGIRIDAVFFDVRWMEDQLARVLVRHQASLGYTTCFWHTVRVSQPIIDKQGWFQQLQTQAAQPYPTPLVKAILAQNYPVLRQLAASSYFRQLEKALQREDVVSVNHRTAALLASYFDILFAVNRVLHPGEKRLLDFAEQLCPKLPRDFRATLLRVLQADATLLQHITSLLDNLDSLLMEEGWL